mgnify:CR=1 FL=1
MMKYFFTYGLFYLFLLTGCFQFAQAQIQNASVMKPHRVKGKHIVCPIGKHDGKHYHLTPPLGFLRRARTQSKKSNIEVTYNGFSPEAQAAFQFAVEIWETLLPSPVTIRVNANCSRLAPGLLGAAGPTIYEINFKNAPLRNVWYPIALAEKIAGENLNDEAPDISANFNNSINWYFGTDGNPGNDEVDLVSVVLHELGHGLGLAPFREYNNSDKTFSLGFNGAPDTYSYHLVDGNSNSLRDTTFYPPNSTELGTAVTNNSLFFSGLTTNTAANNATGSKIYAPAEFVVGSSLAHLDDIYINTPNTLMTSGISFGEAQHDPGPIVVAMLNDMGWRTTRLTVSDTIRSTETAAANYPVKFSIDSDTTYQVSEIKFFYSLDSMKTPIALTPTATGVTNEFMVTIPGVSDGNLVAYYAEVTDDAGRVIQSPSQATDFNAYFFFFVGPDNVPPTLTHTPLTSVAATADSAVFSAESTDIFGLSSVQVIYSINGVNQPPIDMTVGTDFDLNRYTGVMRFNRGQLRNEDVINYSIVATDNSGTQNTTTLPTTGTYKIEVKGLKAPQSKYQTDFNDIATVTDDFIGNNFSIRLEPGFSDGAIHSDHPYLVGSGVNNQSNFVYQLRVPIIVNAQRDDAWMRFDEVILVEPGEPNANFGSLQFYDYFIVEGSIDGGNTWTQLGNGYDAGANLTWESFYFTALSGDNSAAQGNSNLFKPRFYNLRDVFNAGATVAIRFRLFSDRVAYGWGVALDNLNIQDGVVGIEEFIAVNSTQLKMFPNPNSGQFNLQATFKKPVETLPVSLTNLQGQQVYRTTFKNVGKQFSGQMKPGQLTPGVYFVNLHLGNYRLTKKIMIR